MYFSISCSPNRTSVNALVGSGVHCQAVGEGSLKRAVSGRDPWSPICAVVQTVCSWWSWQEWAAKTLLERWVKKWKGSRRFGCPKFWVSHPPPSQCWQCSGLQDSCCPGHPVQRPARAVWLFVCRWRLNKDLATPWVDLSFWWFCFLWCFLFYLYCCFLFQSGKYISILFLKILDEIVQMAPQTWQKTYRVMQ